jgi:chromosome partitioning protein
VELVGIMGREYRLKKALGAILGNFDFILIDCPPSLGLLTINGLSAANSVLIPIQCEYYALEGLSQLVNTINLVKENLNSSLEIEGVLLTMADFRTNLTNEVIKEARNFFKEKVYDTVIPRSIRLTEAPGFGKPIALYDKTSIGAQKYQEFTNELLGLKKEIIQTETSASVDNSNSNNELEKVGEGDIK